jgi:hypothetical protein
MDTLFEKLPEILQKNLERGLDPTGRDHYMHCPPGITEEELSHRLRSFISSHLREWLRLIEDVIPHLTEKDVESMGSDRATPNAEKLMGLYHFLETHGVPGAREFNQPLNLWSGTESMKRAAADETTRCDSKIPAISMMFCLSASIKETLGKRTDLNRLLENASSKILCLNASGITNVYINSDKISESAGFTLNNNFWSVELTTLQCLLAEGRIPDVHFHLYNHLEKAWLAPRSLARKEACDIPLRRRDAYLFSHEHLSEAPSDPRFKRLNMKKEEVDAWTHSAPRPALTFGQLQKIAARFKTKVKEKAVRRVSLGTPDGL